MGTESGERCFQLLASGPNRLLDLLGGYALTPALKGVMAVLSDDPAWLRVRPPLVALTPESVRALEREVRAFGIDPETD